MKLALFDYYLPKNLIAQKPARPRDHSRLMVVDRQTKRISHRHFFDLPEYLHKGDVLVLNNTKVFPARLWAKKEKTGGKIEVLLLKQIRNSVWEGLIGGKIRKEGMILQFGHGLDGAVIKKMADGIWQIKFNKRTKEFWRIINQIGEAPTPPYIKLKTKSSKTKVLVKENYQTVFANKIGSVAAPTAGLHFTKKLLKQLKKQGVQIEYITLHVGFGTFQPVKEKDIEKHQMHPEWVEVGREGIDRLKKAKEEGRRIIAVGTTSVRVLETLFRNGKRNTKHEMLNTKYKKRNFRGWANTFIYPGYQFQFIDAMITNFHLPKSTLLMLVSAWASRKFILDCYKKAIRKKYRFYSFGDAMLIE